MGVGAVIFQIALAIVSAVISAYLAPKPADAKPAKGGVPTATDGNVIRKIYGTVWVDDSQVLAWKELPPLPIKKKGGK